MKVAKYIAVLSIVLSSQLFAQTEEDACYSCMLQDGKVAAATSQEDTTEEVELSREEVLEAIKIKDGTRHLSIYVDRALDYLYKSLPEEVEDMDIMDAKIQASLMDQFVEETRVVARVENESSQKTQAADIKIINESLTKMYDLILSM